MVTEFYPLYQDLNTLAKRKRRISCFPSVTLQVQDTPLSPIMKHKFRQLE